MTGCKTVLQAAQLSLLLLLAVVCRPTGLFAQTEGAVKQGQHTLKAEPAYLQRDAAYIDSLRNNRFTEHSVVTGDRRFEAAGTNEPIAKINPGVWRRINILFYNDHPDVQYSLNGKTYGQTLWAYMGPVVITPMMFFSNLGPLMFPPVP